MLEVAVLAALVLLGGFAVREVRRRNHGPMAYWTAGCLAFFAGGAGGFLFPDMPWLMPLGNALGTVYTALLLAGALAYAERHVPAWLVPSGLALGAARGLLARYDPALLSQAIELAVEPTLALLAAGALFFATRGRSPSLLQRALAPGLVAIALLEGLSALVAPPGAALPAAYLVAWAISVPLLLTLQIAAVSERTQEILRQASEKLEFRVAERTAELAQSIDDLEEQMAERRAAVLALRESEDRYRTVSELSSDYSFAIRVYSDRSLAVEFVTDGWTRMTGYSIEDVEGNRWREVVHPGDVPKMIPMLQEALAGKRKAMDARLVTKGGETRYFTYRFGATRSESDGSVRLVGAGSDITDHVNAERERRRLEHHMQEVQRLESLGVLAGGIAHDFNNALTVILGNSGLALEQLEQGSALRERLARIHAAAEYASGLTEQMLTYSGKAAITLSPLDLSQLARELLDLMRASVTEKGRLDIELADDLPPIDGDVTQIRQILLNLVTNASDALGPEGGSIRLRTGLTTATERDLANAFGTPDPAPGEYVFLEVSDTGPGIDEELQARVFEPFFTTRSSGRGLGLAAVLGIVSGHRGVIQIESQPGEGTAFRVLIPCSTHSLEVAAEPAAPGASPEGRRTILVVDDDEAVLEIAREFLQRSGFEVHTARGGREGIERLSQLGEEIDAVVLDLVMPDMSGEEAFLEMRRLRPDLPVVISSGYDQGMTERVFARGAAGLVYKPYEPEDLVDRVRGALLS